MEWDNDIVHPPDMAPDFEGKGPLVGGLGAAGWQPRGAFLFF